MGMDEPLDRQPPLSAFAETSLEHFCALVVVFHFNIMTNNFKGDINIRVLAQAEGLSVHNPAHFSQDQRMQFWDPAGKGIADAQIRCRERKMNMQEGVFLCN